MRSDLSIYCFVAPTNSNYPPIVADISRFVTQLSLSGAAPGGYTDFQAMLPLADARIPRPEFGLFSQVAVMSGPRAVWLGELTAPQQGMNQNNGEYMQLVGLGLGNALRDDPRAVGYTSNTVQQMAIAELNARTVATAKIATISSDTRLIFPDNPATLYSPSYDNNTMEEVIADLCTLAGDYQWGVWAHPTQVNALGFPLGQLSVQQRDTTTTHYIASIAEQDVVEYTVTPSADRAYNVVSVDYSNATGGVGNHFAADARLDLVTWAQKNAPFRYRKLVRDYSGTSTIGSTQAQSIASNYMHLYNNVSNKVTFTLQSVKDAQGNPIPLWEVAADKNIFIRDFAPRGAAPLPSSPTPGVNQFYIVSYSYREDQSGTMQLLLECDNFADREATQIARLTLAADAQSRSGKTVGVVQRLGAPANGMAVIGQSNAVSGQPCAGPIMFPNALYQAPTSIAFTAITSTGLGSVSAAHIGVLGAIVEATATLTGAVLGQWTYTTSGNCVRRVGRKLFDWHCDGCDTEFRGLHLGEHLRVETGLGTHPGAVALAVDCPECGAGDWPFTESFNTGLSRRDEEHPRHPHRAEQARLIRALMRSGAVGLDVAP